MIRALRIISLSAACIFLISAVTGIQRLHFSTETGFSVAMHTTATRLIALVVGLVFIAWFFGLRQHTRWGIWGTNFVFIGIICVCLWQGIGGAIKGDTASLKMWSIGSQTALTLVGLFSLAQDGKKTHFEQVAMFCRTEVTFRQPFYSEAKRIWIFRRLFCRSASYSHVLKRGRGWG